MTTSLSRRSLLKRSAMAATILPVSHWYTPGGQSIYSPFSSGDGPIKLNSNENAYGPSDSARKAVLDSLDQANRYPWDITTTLKKEIAKQEGLTDKYVMVTAGSTELLGLAGLVYGLNGGELVACHPTFDFLMLYAERMGCTWARTPLDEHHQTDLKALEKATGSKTKLIFICNPNNPTGVELPAGDLRSFVKAQAKQYPVYIDEAYIELSADGKKSSMASLVDEFPNLIIGRTFSKVYGLAGMRIGYALAHPDTIQKLSGYHTGRGMTISVASAAAAIACLNDLYFESFSREKIKEGRYRVTRAFDAWKVEYLPSSTNFIFFKNDRFGSDPVAFLEKEGILIRSYSYVPGWSRVSVGKVEEMDRFLDVMGRNLV